jgi:hypothetical protein
MTQDFDKQLKKQAAIKGVILGSILGVLGILSFYFMTTMATSFVMIIGGPFVLSIIIPIILGALFCVDLRKSVGGFWSFKQAVTGIFVMFFLSLVMSFLIRDMLFAKVIEPNMVEKTQTAMVNAVTNMLEKSSASQADIDKKIDEMEKQLNEQKNASIGKQIQSFAVSIIFVFVISLVFAIIFKKERPLYMNDVLDGDPTV